MKEKNPVFAGVDIVRTSGRLRRSFVYAALDMDRELLALGHGDCEEVLAYLGGQASAYVAVNAPRKPNTGAVQDTIIQQNKQPIIKSGHMTNIRLCEYCLQAQGCKITATPNTIKACPGWMQRGFSLYTQLEGFGYQTFPEAGASHYLLETQSEAVFWRLLNGKTPLPDSLEGRLQRQLILHSMELPVPDAMDFFLEITRFKLIQGELPDQDIHPFEELNALAAAYIAWQAAYHPTLIELIGDSEEGQIALPTLA